MPMLNSSRGRHQRDEARRDKPYRTVYEPGPIQRALMTAWEVLEFYFWSPLIWLAQILWLAGGALLRAWIR